MKSTSRLRIFILILILIPVGASAYSYSTMVTHARLEGMNNFEIRLIGVLFDPTSAVFPQDSGWEWICLPAAGDEAIIKFYGETPLPPDVEFTFGIEMDTADTWMSTYQQYWTHNDDEFHLPQPLVAIEVDEIEYTAKVTLHNNNPVNTIEFMNIKYKVTETPIPLNDLNCYTTPPPSLHDSGVPPLTHLGPGEEIEFTVSVGDPRTEEPDAYLIVYMTTWWVGDPGPRDYNETGAAIYVQTHTNEMVTPAATETWSGVKVRYE